MLAHPYHGPGLPRAELGSCYGCSGTVPDYIQTICVSARACRYTSGSPVVTCTATGWSTANPTSCQQGRHIYAMYPHAPIGSDCRGHPRQAALCCGMMVHPCPSGPQPGARRTGTYVHTMCCSIKPTLQKCKRRPAACVQVVAVPCKHKPYQWWLCTCRLVTANTLAFT